MIKETKCLEMGALSIRVDKEMPEKVGGNARIAIALEFKPIKVIKFKGKKYLLKNPRKNKRWTLSFSRASKYAALLVYEKKIEEMQVKE